MRIRIRHETRYDYGAPVLLLPQRLRLRPREGPELTVLRHDLQVSPTARPRWSLDADGNAVASCWFEGLTRRFAVVLEAEVRTIATDAFDFVLDDGAVDLPIRLSAPERSALAPFVAPRTPPRGRPGVAALAAEVRAATGPSTVAFLVAACRAVHERTTWIRRPRGRARPASITLAARRGACRDTAVLLAEVFRSVGLPARFVSGYAVVPIADAGHDLHAWTEVYLPGAGWRGFDPTRGLAVDERYVPLAASATPEGAAPIAGGFVGGKGATMTASVAVQQVSA